MNYAKIAVTVNKLIDKNGRFTFIQKIANNGTDTEKPWKSEFEVELSVKVKGVFVPAFNSENLGLDFISPDLLSRADEIFLVGPNSNDFSDFHSVVDGGLTWGIKFVQVLKPADIVLLYAIGVRR